MANVLDNGVDIHTYICRSSLSLYLGLLLGNKLEKAEQKRAFAVWIVGFGSAM